MKLHWSSFIVFLFAATTAIPADNDGPPVDPKDLRRPPAVTPADALKTFEIKKGFHLEAAATEPLVNSPIALSFDENGRMFVVEMIDYSERREETPHPGRIRMLEDTDGDGRFDKATVFADNLPWPTAVFCANGGVFVAATPDVLFFKDLNGDGVADTRQTVFTGFGSGVERLNVQAMVNSFVWGMDNRIHGSTAGNGGSITLPQMPSVKPLNLRGRDFSFDPRTLEMRAEGPTAQYGISFDDHGRKFVCSNSDHIQVLMYDARYAGRNTRYAMPNARVSIAADGPAAEVYRISPDEGWRVIRTTWRVTGVVKGLVEGGGRPSGYFTSACGLTIYRGNAWPAEYRGDAIIADCGSNLVHHKRLRPDGVSLIAERPADEQKTEFLRSRDLWFRPVQFANAPDGTLYVIDMCREVIEHPWSLPQSIKKLLDLNAGNDRGRIYRVAPDGFKQPKPPRLGKATTAELVATLEHPNGWHRDTAARLLYERQDKNAVPLLTKLLAESKSPLGRLHALHALDGLGALGEPVVLQALGDGDATVREHTVKLSEKLLSDGTISDALWARLRALPGDADIQVRYQLAFTLGEIKRPDRVKALAEIARRDGGDKWVQAAILSSLTEGTGEMFAAATGDAAVRDSSGGQQFLRQLVQVIGAGNKPGEVGPVLDYLAKVNDPALAFSLVRALGDGLQRARNTLAKADTQGSLKIILGRASFVAVDDKSPESTRVQAIQLLGLTRFADNGSALLSLLNQQQAQTIQSAVIGTLGRFSDAQVGPELVARWAALTPRLRVEALDVLLARADRVEAVLKAVEDSTVRASELSSNQIKFLTTHRDAAIRARAGKLFSSIAQPKRQDVVNTFMPALSLNGDAVKGKKIYEERCISCHRIGGEGNQLGPDFVTIKNTGKEKILTNILDPNREVLPQYFAYLIETKDDESLLGLLVNETATSVTLRQGYGKETTVPRSNITVMKSQGLSLMPEGLEQGLTPQALADLLEFIVTTDAGK